MNVRFCLAELLAARGLSQRQLAIRSNVSPTIVQRIATNNAKQVALATLGKLADELGVEPGELIARDTAKRGKR